jgi:hypothetical protein
LHVFGLDTLSLAILCAVGMAALGRSLFTHVAIGWLNRERSGRTDHAPAFVILLPVLREQALVAQTLGHFTGLEYPNDRYRIVVVTSEREETEREQLLGSLNQLTNELWDAKVGETADRYLTGHFPRQEVSRLLALRRSTEKEKFETEVAAAYRRASTTGQVVDEFSRSNSRVVRAEAPARFRRKAGQLRFAFDQLDQILGDWDSLSECRFVGIYDFDARPAKDVLWRVAEAAESESPVLQQPGLTVPHMQHGSTGLFTIMDGQLHARLGLRVELWSLLSDRVLPQSRRLNAVLRSSVHAVGNGLFLDRRSLPELGGIPEVVDDLAIGWRAAATALPISPIPSPVFYEAYASARGAARSREFICTGYLRAVGDISAAPGTIRFVLPLQLAKIYYRLFQWTVGPAVRLSLLLWCAAINPLPTLSVCVLIYAAFLTDIATVRRYWAKNGVAPHASVLRRLLTLVLSPAALIWYGAGARAGLWNTLVRKRAPTTAKTER